MLLLPLERSMGEDKARVVGDVAVRISYATKAGLGGC